MLLASGYARPAAAQEAPLTGPFPNFFNTFNCYPAGPPTGQKTVPGGPIPQPVTRWSENGHALTPRGTMRVLVVYAGFNNDNVDHSIQGASNIPNNNISDPQNPWPQQLNGSAWGESLPPSAASTFYTGLGQFSTTAADQTLSNFYYQMSQHGTSPFRLLAVNFPVRVNVTATTAINQSGGWGQYSQMALDQIRTNPTLQGHMLGLNRSLLDARKNAPDFQSDNSTSTPDNQIDYTVIIWRYAGGSPGKNGPMETLSLASSVGSGGGYADVPRLTLIPASGSTPALTTADGFTQCAGISGVNHELFTHEFAHTLYWAPHLNGNNGVSGRKYYVTTGNSMTTGNINAWERWYLGWIPLQCSGVSGDLTGPATLTSSGRYWLRDFITTGDALRIRLPNTYNPATNTYQHLWLENRQKKSIWDQRQWTNNGAGQPFPIIPTGIMAYVEDMGQNKNNPLGINGFWDRIGANGLKYLSAAGHYDQAWQGNSSTYNNALWGNLIYNFNQGAANPTGGQSNFMFLRGDKNSNGTIGYTTDPNSASANEYFHFTALNSTPTYGFMGNDARHNPARKIGMDSNPALASNPDFDASQQQMAPMQLSGVSVKMLDYTSNGDILVEVSFTDTDVAQSTRWTGNLKAWDVPGAANDYDVNVLAGVTLRIDRSGTPNRTTPGPKGDFINDTYFALSKDALFNVEATGIVEIGNGSTFFVEDGARLVAERDAKIIVEGGGRLSVQTQAEADALRAYGQLDLRPDGRLEIRESGTIIFGRNAASLAVFPNPSSGAQVNFALSGISVAEAAAYTYRLLTPYGQALRQGRCGNTAISVNGVPAGTYLLELTSPAGQRLTRRVQLNP